MKQKHYSNKNADKRGKKDWRKPYRGKRKSANFDWSCRHQGGCAYCESNRTHNNDKREADSKDHLKDYERTDSD